MSLSKSTTRRVALFTSSSLMAAGLTALATAGAALTPSAANAQAVCVSAPAPTGSGTNTVTYPAGTYNPSIDCVFTGTAATVSTGGAISVSTVAPGGGVNLTAAGSSAIGWNSTAGTVTGGAQTNGPVIDATSVSGAIDIRTGQLNANGATVSHGIRAQSTSGSIGITALGNINATNSTTGNTGISAVTGGAGAIDITTGVPDTSAGATVQGRLRGIYAETLGDGDLTINANRNVTGTSTSASVGIEAITRGDGLLTINLNGQPNTSESQVGFPAGGVKVDVTGGSAGAGLRTNTMGDAVINVGMFSSLSGGWGLDATVGAGTTTTLNVANQTGGLFPLRETEDGRVTRIRGAGAGTFVANIDGVLFGGVDFTGMTAAGSAQINITEIGIWRTQTEAVAFGPGDDVLATAAAGEVGVGGFFLAGIRASGPDYTPDPTHIIDFGDGDDTMDIAGWFIVNPNPDSVDATNKDNFEGEVRLVGLETFNLSGGVFMGGATDGDGFDINLPTFLDTDQAYDDILSMPGTRVVGAGGSFVFDVETGGSQANCTDRDENGDLGASDCLILAGGSVEGPVNITIKEISTGGRGRINDDGIVLVEMPGGTSAQGDFVVGPDTRGYNPLFGGVMDKGAYIYGIVWDAETEQHILYGLVSPHSMQMSLVAHVAQDLWRTSTGTWLDRQADMRTDLNEGVGGGIWMRATGESAERELEQALVVGETTFPFDSSYRSDAYAVNGGIDLLYGAGGDTAYVVGVTAGYANSEFEYDANPATGQYDGWTGGVYGSLLFGGLYVDAIVNANKLILKYDVPAFNFIPEGTIIDTNLLTVGAQLEAGFKFPVVDNLFVEPLANLSYVQVRYDDLEIPAADPLDGGVSVSYDDPTSLRVGLGGRVGLDQDFGGLRTQFSLLGRYWDELDGESALSIHNISFPDEPDTPLSQEFSGSFTELGLSAGVHALDGAVSGFVKVGGKFNDEYTAENLSAGIRVQW